MKSVPVGVHVTALFVLAVCATALAQNGFTFLINGKPNKLETIEKNGKVFVEAGGFAKALGLSANYNKTTKTFVIAGDAATASATNPAQGTTQLAGGLGEFAKPYTIGKTYPINFILRGAEYTLTRQTLKDTYAPKADQKLLVLHFTVQNPSKTSDYNFYYGSLIFNAVDENNVTTKFDGYVAREGSTQELSVPLKPAQKIDAYIAWPVAGNAKIPKLIVQSPESASLPVVRYELGGKIKPLTAPFVDSNDKTGSVALSTVVAQANTYYPMGGLDVRFDGAAFSTEQMEKRLPGEGKRFFVANFSIKNGTPKDFAYYYGTFKIELTDSEGTTTKFNDYPLRPTRDEHNEGTLQANAETKFRVFFELPNDVAGKTISISEEGQFPSRTYSFDVSGVK